MLSRKWPDNFGFALMKKYTKSEIKAFLENVNILTLAAVGERGPISSPLLFTVDDQLNFFFATHRDSFKSQAILNHPKVGLSIWQFDNILIQVDASCTVVTDTDQLQIILTQLATAVTRINHFWPPVLQISGDEYIVFRACPTWLRVLDLSNQSILSGDTPFMEISL